MTPEIFLPLHNAIIWAQQCADPLLWHEAVRRFDAIDRMLGFVDGEERVALEERLFDLLPSDWPLWQETCRRSSPALQSLQVLH